MKIKNLTTMIAVVLIAVLFGFLPSCNNGSDGLGGRIPRDNKAMDLLIAKQDSVINNLVHLLKLKDERLIETFKNGYLRGQLDAIKGNYNNIDYRLNEYKKRFFGKNSK